MRKEYIMSLIREELNNLDEEDNEPGADALAIATTKLQQWTSSYKNDRDNPPRFINSDTDKPYTKSDVDNFWLPRIEALQQQIDKLKAKPSTEPAAPSAPKTSASKKKTTEKKPGFIARALGLVKKQKSTAEPTAEKPVATGETEKPAHRPAAAELDYLSGFRDQYGRPTAAAQKAIDAQAAQAQKAKVAAAAGQKKNRTEKERGQGRGRAARRRRKHAQGQGQNPAPVTTSAPAPVQKQNESIQKTIKVKILKSK